MPRPPRLHLPGAFHHVTLRGNHQQPIFGGDRDRSLLSSLVAEAVDKYATRVHCYCWMSNHLHLIIEIGTVPLGRFMQRVASRYARRIQVRVPTTGHLFERRYHAELVARDAHLLEAVRYIHLNPVRANMVRNASDYRWSSHHAYAGLHHDNWLTTDFVLAMFHPERPQAVEVYQRFLRDGLERAPQRTAPKAGSLDTLIEEWCSEARVSRRELASDSRERRLTSLRARIALAALERGLASLSEVARRFGRDESSLRESIKRLHKPHSGPEPPNPHPAPDPRG